MSSHSRKRQFQPSIDSFFAPSTHTSQSQPHSTIPRLELCPLSADALASSQPLRGPILAESVQSSLFTVGMRVRKAVPEGYKTQKELEKTKNALFEDMTVPSAVLYKSSTRARSGGGLVPYCGLTRIGGLETSTAPGLGLGISMPSYDDTYIGNEDFEGSSFYGSSQESIQPDLEVRSSATKRRFVDEEEEGNDVHVDQRSGEPVFTFGAQMGFGRSILNEATPVRERVLARPKSKVKGVRWVDQQGDEGRRGHARTGSDFDFGEASFLGVEGMEC